MLVLKLGFCSLITNILCSEAFVFNISLFFHYIGVPYDLIHTFCERHSDFTLGFHPVMDELVYCLFHPLKTGKILKNTWDFLFFLTVIVSLVVDFP